MNNVIRLDIHENALTTDYIEKCKSGYVYSNRGGARYKIVYYTYANEWGDHEHSVYGKTLKTVMQKYQRATHRLDDVQEDLSEMDADGNYETTKALAEMIDYIEE